MSRRLTSAIIMGAVAHDGQDYGDHAYIWHPLAVAEDLQRRGYDEDTVIAGVLHDAVEDTGVTIEEIREEFGDRVAAMVAGMTKAKGQDNGEYIRAMPFESVPIKLSDTFKNFFGLASMTDEARRTKLTERYLRNISHLIGRMAGEGRFPDLTKREMLAFTLASTTYPEGWGA